MVFIFTILLYVGYHRFASKGLFTKWVHLRQHLTIYVPTLHKDDCIIHENRVYLLINRVTQGQTGEIGILFKLYKPNSSTVGTYIFFSGCLCTQFF